MNIIIFLEQSKLLNTKVFTQSHLAHKLSPIINLMNNFTEDLIMTNFIVPTIAYLITLYGLYLAGGKQIDDVTLIFGLIGLPVLIFLAKSVFDRTFGSFNDGAMFMASLLFIYFSYPQ